MGEKQVIDRMLTFAKTNGEQRDEEESASFNKKQDVKRTINHEHSIKRRRLEENTGQNYPHHHQVMPVLALERKSAISFMSDAVSDTDEAGIQDQSIAIARSANGFVSTPPPYVCSGTSSLQSVSSNADDIKVRGNIASSCDNNCNENIEAIPSLALPRQTTRHTKHDDKYFLDKEFESFIVYWSNVADSIDQLR